MVEWHEVAFGIPKLGSLSDEQLEGLYSDRDGPWSAAVKAALRRFGTDKLYLDDNWASRSPDWECPACGRRKPDLMRMSDGSVLLARLDIHHDHLTDYFKTILQTKHGPQWRAVIPPDTAHIEKLGAQLVARFEPSTVCSDCNSADGAVKGRHHDIPRSFSFRPSEIRRFVRPRPNAEHEIDYDLAHSLFGEVRADFERRVALVDMLAGILLAGEMTVEPGNLPSSFAGNPLGILHYLHGWFSRGCDRSAAIHQDLADFEARSVSRDGVASNPKKKSRAVVRPTEEEIASYDGGGAADLWHAAPADWRCPACGRDRADMLRRSNNRKRPWAGKLVRHTEFILVDGSGGYEDEFVVEPYIDRHELHLVCLDCATILPGVKSRWSDVSASRAILQFRDMMAVTQGRPNQPHVVDWAAAAERARASLSFAALVERYWRLHDHAVHCRSVYRSLLAKCGGDEKRAWARLKSYFAEELEGMEDPDEHLDWLLTEADRIGIDDPYCAAPKEPAAPPAS